MRVCILTTETLHHAYFASALAADGHLVLALVEEGKVLPPFETDHPFEAARDTYERTAWFGGRQATVGDFAEVRSFADVNDAEAVRALAAFGADLTVTFGTRRLRSDLISAGGARLVNLHGGDPEHYRGLDTHLWAIWHGDFAALSTCLHRVAEGLDTGDLVGCLPVAISPGMELHQLRRANTETAVRLTRMALEQQAVDGRLTTRPQRQVGRYYSFMPATLKTICVERFARFTTRLVRP